MQVRNPVVAGAFYPYDSKELKNIIKDFLDKTKVEKKEVIGMVSPHAGYVYCGKTAASVYKTISNKFETAIILGPNHSGMGAGVATCLSSWKTPLGLVETDKEFFDELIEDSVIMEDTRAHLREHSIEVQLPWLQYRFKNFKIVPISINRIYFDVKTCREIGNKIADVVNKLKRKVLIIASSDFTHYGYMYGYTPFKGKSEKVIKKIKEMDMSVINSIEKLKSEDVLKTCNNKRLTICGYGAIASMLFAAKKLNAKKGELIDYSTSFDLSRNLDAVVGYAGIAIY
jgi:AmmeMemoRadiSam system protein B